MSDSPSIAAQLDAQLESLLADWNITSTILASALFLYLVWPLFTFKDADVHPLLLARQASPAPTRRPGETAVYRSLDAPHGYPLRAGLNIKDPGSSKWTAGRPGDLRDIWRQALKGPVKEDGSPAGEKGKVYTLDANKKVVEHSLDEITVQINALGQYLKKNDVKTVAICLHDSVELLASIFAAAFYGVKPVLVPNNLPPNALIAHLTAAQPSCLVAEGTLLDGTAVVADLPSLKHLVLVKDTSKNSPTDVNWNSVYSGQGKQAKVMIWSDLLDSSNSEASSELPPLNNEPVSPLYMFSPVADTGVGELVGFTSENIVSAIAAQLAALPRLQRITAADLLLNTNPLYLSHPLMLTLGALFSNASVALTSHSGEIADFAVATAGFKPTLITASSATMQKFHQDKLAPALTVTAKLGRMLAGRSLQAGNMSPSQNGLTKIAYGCPSSQFRMLFISYHAGISQPELTPSTLNDLRIFLHTRVVYALAVPGVAGAVAQSNAFDYRLDTASDKAHFGAPLSSVEIKLVEGKNEEDLGGSKARGKIFVAGPAVVGGKTNTGLDGKFGSDNTLCLA